MQPILVNGSLYAAARPARRERNALHVHRRRQQSSKGSEGERRRVMQGRAAMAAAALAVAVTALLAGQVPVPSPSSVPILPPGFPLDLGVSGREPTSAPIAEARPAGASWRTAQTESYAVALDGGEVATGIVGVPAEAPTTLVVLAHPWSVPAEAFRDPLQELAEAGVLAVAMEFRGARDDYKVKAGVEDTVAAALDLQGLYPTIDRTLLFGHSMGGQVALLAAATAPPETFDYVFVGAGVTDLEALWHANVPVRPYVERETGGTPMEAPAEYTRRSPIDRVAGLAAQGVARYFLVYGSGDPAVPLDHAERLYKALDAAGLPVSYYVVTTDEDPQWCVPVANACPGTTPAAHWAGRFDLMRPFIDNRIARLPDPDKDAIRGTYDGDSGQYDPSDVG